MLKRLQALNQQALCLKRAKTYKMLRVRFCRCETQRQRQRERERDRDRKLNINVAILTVVDTVTD